MKTILFRITLVGTLTACSFHAQNSPGRVLPRYSVIDLGPVGGPPGQPFVIRNSGLISGSAAVSATAWHAVLWFQGVKIDIASPGFGGPSSAAFGVNERGQTVGEAESSKPDQYGEDFCGFGSRLICRPFVWQNGMMAALPPLTRNGNAGTNGAANAINSRGQIVGTAEDTQRDPTCPMVNPALGQYQQFSFKPVLWEKGKIQELPTVGGDPDGIAFAINDSGQSVGATGTCTAFQANGNLTYLYGHHATLWQNGTVTDLGNLGGISPGGGNAAININNRGQVVGSSGTVDGSFHGFLWSKETGIRDVGVVQNDIASVALGINDQGDVVGISFDEQFNARAFVRPDGGVPVDLNSLLPADHTLFLIDACSINSRGEIIGFAMDSAGVAHGYLAVPGDSAGEIPAARLELEQARKVLRQRRR